jgi:nicotinamide phosphoribosyltransferase
METLCFKTDSYKHSHYQQFPKGTTSLFYYLESRGGKFAEVTWFGLQAILKRYFGTSGVHPVTMEHVDWAEARVRRHGEPFNRAGWERIVKVHGGRIPMRIRAVPEGTTVPVHNVLMTVESTDPELPWVPGYFETVLERVWYPMTVCTQSREAKKVILGYLRKTSDLVDELIGTRLHDFGARGVSSGESAAIGDCAHLVNFIGTDTMEGLELAAEYYGEEMAGISIPAMEHSTVTSWGRKNEAAAYRNMLDHYAKPGAFLACVSDSYDLWNAVDHIWGDELRQKVVESGATVVIRPDSGDPASVVVKTMQLLAAKFGTTTNTKGYRVLNNVAVIQGDGITFDTIGEILEAVVKAGFSTGNLAFGSGGGLLQKLDRDTQRVAYKASDIVVDGEHRPVFKDPVTDPGKRSKAGRLDLVFEDGQYRTIVTDTPAASSALRTVWEDGRLLVDESLSVIRARASEGL